MLHIWLFAIWLFAIAYMHSLASGKDPAKVKFAQNQMRNHFLDCLKRGVLSDFPIERTLSRAARPDTHLQLRLHAHTFTFLYMVELYPLSHFYEVL